MNRIARRLMILSRLPRVARGAGIAAVLTLAVAAPAAAASPAAAVATPIRTVHHDLTPFTIPAGQACTFDVQGQPYWGFSAKTVFPNGLIFHSVRAHGAYVNAETGARYETADNFFAIDNVDPVTNIDHVTLDGMAADSFLPGDTGPYGIVGPGPAFYDFVGRITFDYNLDTGVTTNFTWKGTATDICAALS
jgi:hypothetical protein